MRSLRTTLACVAILFAATSAVAGTMVVEARDSDGDLVSVDGKNCRSLWDLATGSVNPA